MPTKQEIICMMENHLPGEPVTIDSSSSRQPPAYPTLEGVSTGEQMQSQQYGQTDGRVFSIAAPAPVPINHPPDQFGARPHLTYCPTCRTQQMSRVNYQTGMMTHIIAAILCCTTCSCCLPYLFDSCKTARHYCPTCNSYLGAQMK